MAFLYIFYIFFKRCCHYIASKDIWQSNMAITCVLVLTAFFVHGITEYFFPNSVSARPIWFMFGVIYAAATQLEKRDEAVDLTSSAIIS